MFGSRRLNRGVDNLKLIVNNDANTQATLDLAKPLLRCIVGRL